MQTPSPRLTIHVLDMAKGVSAQGMKVSVSAPHLAQAINATTAIDGRSPSPLLSGENFAAATYQLRFALSAYFRANGYDYGSQSPFLDEAVVSFNADGSNNYHIPLVITPWSYAVYRGS